LASNITGGSGEPLARFNQLFSDEPKAVPERKNFRNHRLELSFFQSFKNSCLRFG
jgi:hypothetical protein